MKKNLSLMLLCGMLAATSCQKSSVVAPEDSTKTSTDPTLRTNVVYTGNSAYLTLQPNGTYTASYEGTNFVFSNIVHRSGPFNFGENVESYDVYCSGGVVTANGGYFIAEVNVIPAGSFAAMATKLSEYNTEFNQFINGDKNPDGSYKQATLPSFKNKMSAWADWTQTIKGVVVRDPNSPSTFSIQGADFTPVIPSAESEVYLGDYYHAASGTTFSIYGKLLRAGTLTRVEAANSSGPVAVYGFNGTCTSTETGMNRVVATIVIGNINATPISIDVEIGV